MFSFKILFAASVAVSTVSLVSADATAKADCWYGSDCTGVLTYGDGQCLLPPQSSYPLPTGAYPIAYYMGAPEHFCGNRKSLNPDVPTARLEALQYCFDIGASSACIWGECHLPDSCVTTPPGGWGDPHFRLWNGDVYDYHGICDLLFFESPSHNLTIHIRTTQKFHYSYVSSAAIELNGEVLELGSWGSMIHNGVAMVGADERDIPSTFGGCPLAVEVNNKKTHTYDIILPDGQAVQVKSYKEMVGLKIIGSRGAFADSRGLMGSAAAGQKLGRDGVTVFEDDNLFGQEWQVQENEKKLFEADREPQAPQTCRIPDDTQTARRLGETMARAEAEAACANWHMNKEACITDVMVTGDKEFAANVF